MMISQLATVAIRARLRVSPATVLPKLVIRSKSRSRLFWSAGRELVELRPGRPRARGRSGGSASSGRPPERLPRSAAGATISNRAVGLAILACVEDLGELGRDDLRGRLRAVERGRVELQLVLPAAGEPVDHGRRRRFASGRRRRRGGGDRLAGSPTVISTRCEAGPNALRIVSLTFSVFCSVVRMLNRVRRLVAADLEALDGHVGQARSPSAARSWPAATRSAFLTSGSSSLSRIVTSVPPVKSMLYIDWPRSEERDQAEHDHDQRAGHADSGAGR